MRSTVTEAATTSHRGRFAWLAGLMFVSLVAFAATRPEPEMPVWSIGHCVDADGHVHAIRVPVVPAYR